MLSNASNVKLYSILMHSMHTLDMTQGMQENSIENIP